MIELSEETAERETMYMRRVDEPFTPDEIRQYQTQLIKNYRKGHYLATEIETISPDAPFSDKFGCFERFLAKNRSTHRSVPGLHCMELDIANPDRCSWVKNYNPLPTSGFTCNKSTVY